VQQDQVQAVTAQLELIQFSAQLHPLAVDEVHHLQLLAAMVVLAVVLEMVVRLLTQVVQVQQRKVMTAAVTAALAADLMGRMVLAAVVLAVLENHNLRHLRRQVTA
jgi:hypothetical protein